MGTVTKGDLARLLAGHLGCTKTAAKELVDAFVEAVAGAIARGERIEARGFGVFEVKATRAKDARNPRTGERVFIPARQKVRFRPGKVLREVLSNRRQ